MVSFEIVQCLNVDFFTCYAYSSQKHNFELSFLFFRGYSSSMDDVISVVAPVRTPLVRGNSKVFLSLGKSESFFMAVPLRRRGGFGPAIKDIFFLK